MKDNLLHSQKYYKTTPGCQESTTVTTFAFQTSIKYTEWQRNFKTHCNNNDNIN